VGSTLKQHNQDLSAYLLNSTNLPAYRLKFSAAPLGSNPKVK
jgi:hypothetical protein